MKHLWTIFSFEFHNLMTKKATRIALGVMVCVILIGTSIPTAMGLFSKGEEEGGISTGSDTYSTVGYVISGKVNREALEKTPFFAGAKPYDTEEALRRGIADESITSGILVDDATHFTYVLRDQSMGDNIPGLVQEVLTKYQRDRSLERMGIDPTKVDEAMAATVTFNVDLEGKSAGQNFLFAYFGMFMIYFVVILYGQTVSTTTAREKDDRTMELLITSTDPKWLIIGKVFAAGLIGVVQMGAILLALVLGFQLNKGSYPLALVNMIKLSVTWDVLAVFLIYGVIGYLLYLFIYAALGALVSKVEDVNTAVTPITLLFVVVFFFCMFTLSTPDSTVAKVASIVPFSSVMAMFIRYSMTTVPLFDMVISFVLQIVSVVGMAYVSIKIYRMGSLNYGNRIGLIKAIRMVFSKL